MHPRELLEDLAHAGITVAGDGQSLVIRPASKLNEAMREAIRKNKRELLALLATSLPEDLERAIHEVCDKRGDDPANRQALLYECRLQTPVMQADLLAHFNEVIRMYRALLPAIHT